MSGDQENKSALANLSQLRRCALPSLPTKTSSHLVHDMLSMHVSCGCRSLESLLSAESGRFGKVLEAAKEQAAGAGENDLRRLKRQFSSLKNTFMLYDTKEHFIDGEQLRHHRLPVSEASHHSSASGCVALVGLLDDLPDGSEMRKLQDLEEHVRAQGVYVKEIKQQNSKARPMQSQPAMILTQDFT